MANIKRELLSGWGNVPKIFCAVYRPEKERELATLLRLHDARVIARGLGRSYGDASLQPHGVIKTERLNHFIEFSENTGVLRAQSGVTLAEVMEFSIPRGWLPPVIPGTRHVTLGGAFACNIHGKNQYKMGEFAEHVESIWLLMADGKRIECSPTEQEDLFWATAGGMGMTGIIEEISIRLMPIHTADLKAEARRVGNIEEMVQAFETARAGSDYMIGWIDHMATKGEIGRGVFEAASHTQRGDGGRPLKNYKPAKSRRAVPLFAPSFLLNRYTMGLYNKKRFARVKEGSRRTTFDEFFHPLDAIGNWNRLYGKRGFFQYQCLIPDDAFVIEHLRELLEMLQRQKIFSFLAVIKYHRDGKAPLSFSKAGYSIALDLPNSARVRGTLPHINHWVAERGGRVYLAKDALLSQDMFSRMYGKTADDWRHVIGDVDPHGKFSSLMSERLEWKD